MSESRKGDISLELHCMNIFRRKRLSKAKQRDEPNSEKIFRTLPISFQGFLGKILTSHIVIKPQRYKYQFQDLHITKLASIIYYSVYVLERYRNNIIAAVAYSR